MTMVYRQGAVGAMMDEYERAARELAALLGSLDAAAFDRMRDRDTTDPNCHSIRTVAEHVVRAGYGYANYCREAFGMPVASPEVRVADSGDAARQIDDFLRYTEATFEGRWLMSEDEIVAVEIKSRWGPVYDLEQMLEHAIVHILRHRRQIERFLTDPRFA